MEPTWALGWRVYVGSVRFKEEYKRQKLQGGLVKQKAARACPSSKLVIHRCVHSNRDFVKLFSM